MMATRAPRAFVQKIRIFFHLCVICRLVGGLLLSPFILLPLFFFRHLFFFIWFMVQSYNPYKVVVESISAMCQRYDRFDLESLQDFFDNVKVMCKDAKEYDFLFF